jgi:hypothetical protein
MGILLISSVSALTLKDYINPSSNGEYKTSLDGATYKLAKSGDLFLQVKDRGESYCPIDYKNGVRHCAIPIEFYYGKASVIKINNPDIAFTNLAKYNPVYSYSYTYKWVNVSDNVQVRNFTDYTKNLPTQIDLAKPISILVSFDLPNTDRVSFDMSLGTTIVTPVSVSIDPTINIGNCTDLQAMSSDLTADYLLTGNIDCSDTITWNAGAGFLPVGTAASKFSGSFNGQGYTISGLYINRPATIDNGLFGNSASTKTFKNVIFSAANITGNTTNGALIGAGSGAMNVTNIQVINSNIRENGGNAYSRTGSVMGLCSSANSIIINISLVNSNVYTGQSRSGMLIGDFSGTIYNSSVTGSFGSTTGTNFGGIIGYGSSKIYYCFISNTTLNTTTTTIGGITGGNAVAANIISNVYSTDCNINSVGTTGGIAGNSRGLLENSYSNCTIRSTAVYTGGIAGRTYAGSYLNNSFFAGNISGTTSLGAVIGDFVGNMSNTYWNNRTTSTPAVCWETNGSYTTGVCTAIANNEAYFYDITNPPMTSWNFVGIWDDVYTTTNFPPFLFENKAGTPPVPAPYITINSPINGTTTNDINIMLNVTTDGVSAWWSQNNGASNTTYTNPFVIGNSSEGWHTIKVWANNSENTITTNTTIYYMHSTGPSVIINSPTGIVSGCDFLLNASVTNNITAVTWTYCLSTETPTCYSFINPATITFTTTGSHNITVSAEDTYELSGSDNNLFDFVYIESDCIILSTTAKTLQFAYGKVPATNFMFMIYNREDK